MVRPDRITDVSHDATSLWLVVKYDAQAFAFEMVAGASRAVTVGAAEHADVRLSVPEASPLVCYFEREGDDVWIVPGYRNEQLRADTTVVDRPRRVVRRSIVELPGVTLEVRVREEPPTSPNLEIPDFLSEAGPPQSAAIPRRGPSLQELDLVCGGVADDAEDYPTMPLVLPRDKQVHAVVSSAQPETGIPTEQVANKLQTSPILFVDDAMRASTSETAKHHDLSQAEESLHLHQQELEGEPRSEPSPASTAPAVVSLRPAGSLDIGLLAFLGELTTRRPLFVAIGASLGAVILVGVMLGAALLSQTLGSAVAHGSDAPTPSTGESAARHHSGPGKERHVGGGTDFPSRVVLNPAVNGSVVPHHASEPPLVVPVSSSSAPKPSAPLN